MFEAIDRWENEGGAVRPSDLTTNTSTRPEPQSEALRRRPEGAAMLSVASLTQADHEPWRGHSPGRDE